jgi:hypothetical protein
VKWQSRAGWLFLLALVACGSDDDSPDPDGVSGNGGAGAPAAHGGSGAASGESGIAALSGAGGAIGGGSGGAASALRALPACTEAIGSCPSTSIGAWTELLKASDFGADARLVAIGGLGVLVAMGNGSFRLARLHDPRDTTASAPPFVAWDFPNASAQAKPIAILEGRASDLPPRPPNMLVVLTCDAGQVNCSVWSADVTGDQLSSWRQSQLPVSFVGRGLAFDAGVEPQQICAYGSGMLCLADGWQEAIPAGADLNVHAVAFGSWSLAVGEHGRWWKRVHHDAGTGPWQEQTRLEDVTLTQVSVAADGGTIVGEHGLFAAVGTQSDIYQCSVSADLAAFILYPSSRGLGYAVEDSGRVLQHGLITARRSAEYCTYQQLMLSGPVIDSGIAACDDSANPRVLTASALLGVNVCLTII